MKEAIGRAFSHLPERKVEIGLGRELGTLDLHVEAMDNGAEMAPDRRVRPRYSGVSSPNNQ